MPTPYPAPIEKPKNQEEEQHRIKSIYFFNSLLTMISDTAYGTRSHMPSSVDFTEFLDAIKKVRDFANARPDWFAIIMKKTFDHIFETPLEDQEKFFKNHTQE